MPAKKLVGETVEAFGFRLRWSKILQSGPQRMGHCGAIVGRKFYIFGGEPSSNDVYVLDLDTYTWEHLRSLKGSVPSRRSGQACTLVNDLLFISGGLGEDISSCELYTFDITCKEWTCKITYGENPGLIESHTADYMNERNQILVFGDALPIDNSIYQDQGQNIGEVYALDLESFSWYQLPVQGPKPASRTGHASCVVDQSLFIYGGFDFSTNLILDDMNVLDTESLTWSSPGISEYAPSGRVGVKMVNKNGMIIVFGGGDASLKLFNDLNFFDPLAIKWLGKVDVANRLVDGTGDHVIGLQGNLLVVHGGSNSNGAPRDDLYELQIEPN